MTAADGLRAENAAKAELIRRGVPIEIINLDDGGANAHEDEGTDDDRAVIAATRLPETLRHFGPVRGIIVGPSRAIADAVPWRRLPAPVIAIAPLVHEIPCACLRESDLLRSRGSLFLASDDGLSWTDRTHKHYSSLLDAVGTRSAFTVVNRKGFAFRVLPRFRAALLEHPDALDLPWLLPIGARLQALPNAADDLAAQARRAVSMLVD